MARLSLYWADPAFRSGVSKILSLSGSDLVHLRSLTEESFESTNLRDFEQRFSSDDLRLISFVLQTLYLESQAAGSPEQVVQQLQELTSKDGSDASARKASLDLQEKRDAFGQLLTERPRFQRRLERRAAQEAAFPSLERLFLFLDYRVVEDSPELPAKLVPVIMARLSLDEPIQKSDTIAFQISDDLLSSLSDEIQRIRKLLQRTQKQLGDSLF